MRDMITLRKSLYSSDPSMMATLPTCIGLVGVSAYRNVASSPEMDFTLGRFSWDINLFINDYRFKHFLKMDKTACLVISYQVESVSNFHHDIEDDLR